MRLRFLAALAAGAALLLTLPALGAAHRDGLDCRSGYVDGVIGGVHKCLHAGEFCSPAAEADYERYGFSCVDGHLRTGGSGGGSGPKTPPATRVPTRTVLLARRPRAASCVVRGPLPDRRCSPGAIYADATLAMICVSGYSRRVRHVTESTKAAIYAEYGIPRRHYGRPYEVDHIVSL